MGGKSKSSSSSSTSTTQRDERIAATDNAIVLKDVDHLTLTDPGAFDLAGKAISSNEKLALAVIEGAGQWMDNTMSAGEIALDKIFAGVTAAAEKTTSDTTGVQKIAPWLLAGVAVVALSQSLKGR